MPDPKPKMKEAFATTTFNDAGTGQNFTGGKLHSITEGQFLNYQTAGLVREPTSDDRKAAQGDAAPATKPAS